MSPGRAILVVDDDLRLRPFAGDPDVDAAWSWYRDPATVALVDGPHEPAYGRDRVVAMYDALGAQGEVYMIERRALDGWTVVGDVTLAPDTLPIVIAPEHRCQGIGRRVVLRLVDRARVLGWTHLRVREVVPGNEASHRLFTGLGFVPTALGDPAEGVVRDDKKVAAADSPALRHGPSRGYTLTLAPVGGRPRV